MRENKRPHTGVFFSLRTVKINAGRPLPENNKAVAHLKNKNPTLAISALICVYLLYNQIRSSSQEKVSNGYFLSEPQLGHQVRISTFVKNRRKFREISFQLFSSKNIYFYQKNRREVKNSDFSSFKNSFFLSTISVKRLQIPKYQHGMYYFFLENSRSNRTSRSQRHELRRHRKCLCGRANEWRSK